MPNELQDRPGVPALQRRLLSGGGRCQRFETGGAPLWSTASSTGTAGSGCGPRHVPQPCGQGKNTPMPRRNIAFELQEIPSAAGH